MVSTLFDLTGRTAVVTGANTGIGQGIALALAAAGADIAAVGRSAADETAEKVRALGRRCELVSADLSSIEPVTEVVDTVVAKFGRLDILVNNAGIIRREDALDFSEADWDAVMDTNLKTLFFLCQAAARHMTGWASQDGERGKIVNVASLLSFQGGIRVPSYTASKSGVGGLTKLLANEWAPRGINVNAIAPGYIATNNTAALQADETRNRQILERTPFTLALAARALALRGEAVFAIRDTGLVPCSDWDLTTRFTVPTAYRVSIPDTGGGRTETLLANEVLHLRIGSEVSAPYTGIAPLRRARLTGGLLETLETALAEIYADAPLGSAVIPMPEQPDTDMTALARGFRGMRGRVLVRESVNVTAAGGPAPQTDLKPHDVTPDLSKAMTKESLSGAKASIETVFGVLPGLSNPATTW